MTVQTRNVRVHDSTNACGNHGCSRQRRGLSLSLPARAKYASGAGMVQPTITRLARPLDEGVAREAWVSPERIPSSNLHSGRPRGCCPG